MLLLFSRILDFYFWFFLVVFFGFKITYFLNRDYRNNNDDDDDDIRAIIIQTRREHGTHTRVASPGYHR